MKKISKYLLSSMLLLGLASATASATPNLVVNSSFEEGAQGWTVGSAKPYGMYLGETSTGYAHSGTRYAVTACPEYYCVSAIGEGDFFGQEINANVNSYYTLSLWVGQQAFAGDPVGPSGEPMPPDGGMSIFWNGALVAYLIDPAPDTLPFGEHSGMVKYTFASLKATSPKAYFEIHGRGIGGAIAFDDVSVEEEAAVDVPEPSALAILSLGLAGLALSRRMRVRSA